jgi:mitochondrial division protein 1
MAPRGDPASSSTYQTAMTEVHRQLRRPGLQESMFSMARTTPTDMVRSRLSTKEIQSRALSYVPDELLQNIPEGETSYSLFQGFQASFPDFTDDGKKHRRRVSRGRKLLDERPTTPDGSPESVHKLKKEKTSMMHQLEMLGIRKNMASSEIREIDAKIENLAGMRRIILERLAHLEQDEALLEHDSGWPLSLRVHSTPMELTVASCRCRGPVGGGSGACSRGSVSGWHAYTNQVGRRCNIRKGRNAWVHVPVCLRKASLGK